MVKMQLSQSCRSQIKGLFAIALIAISFDIKSQTSASDFSFVEIKSTWRDSVHNHDLDNFRKAVALKDTSKQIQSLLNIAHYYGTQAKYKDSYDILWTALRMSEKSNDSSGIVRVNQRLARHFGFYGRKAEGREYFQKVFDMQYDRVKKNPKRKAILAENYQSMCAFYRDLGDIEMQAQCLDSAMKYVSPKSKALLASIAMEEAVILTHKGAYIKADKVFNTHFETIREKQHVYLVLFNYYHGVNYYYLNKIDRAEAKLNHALEIAYKYNSHLDFVPKIYEMLSKIYIEQGESEKGVAMLKKMAEVNFNFFDSRSDRNKSLLEIQDEKRLMIEEQQAAIKNFQFEELKTTRKLLFFQRSMLIISILLLVLLAYFYMKYLTKKYKLEKDLLKKKREVEIEKAQEIIELKNKELATIALRLIEKDEIVDEFSMTLKKKNWTADAKTLKSFVKAWGSNLDRHWVEFQKHFTDINNSFYVRLHQKYPTLSASDDKLCALIKLKLSSKEISQLLGISNESVHVKRSRLRTKLGLERSVNLTEFMDNV